MIPTKSLKYFLCALVVLAPVSFILHLLMDSYFSNTSAVASNDLWISYPDNTVLVSHIAMHTSEHDTSCTIV